MTGRAEDGTWTMESWIRPQDKYSADIQKSCMVLKDVTPEGLQAFMEQYDKQAQDSPYTKECKMLKSENNYVLFYIKTAMPGSDVCRQMCLEVKTQDLPDGSKFTITQSVDPAAHGVGDKELECIDMFKASKFQQTGDGLKAVEFTTWKT